jgi:hypothetical protein
VRFEPRSSCLESLVRHPIGFRALEGCVVRMMSYTLLAVSMVVTAGCCNPPRINLPDLRLGTPERVCICMNMFHGLVSWVRGGSLELYW